MPFYANLSNVFFYTSEFVEIQHTANVANAFTFGYFAPANSEISILNAEALITETPNSEISILNAEALVKIQHINAEISQLSGEVLYTTPKPNAEIQKITAEIIYAPNYTEAEVSRITVETASSANANAEVSLITVETATTPNPAAEVSSIFIEIASENIDSNAFLYSTISSNNQFTISGEITDEVTHKSSELYVEILSNAASKRVYVPSSGWWVYSGNSWSFSSGSGSGGSGGGSSGSWQFINGVWVWVSAQGQILYFASLPEIISDLYTEVLSANGTSSFTGSLVSTEQYVDTFQSQGKLLIKGSIYSTEQFDSFTSNGVLLIQGNITPTEQFDSFQSQGKLLIQGLIYSTENNDLLLLPGDLVSPSIVTLLRVTCYDVNGYPKPFARLKIQLIEGKLPINVVQYGPLLATADANGVAEIEIARGSSLKFRIDRLDNISKRGFYFDGVDADTLELSATMD